MPETAKKEVGELVVEYQPRLRAFIRKRVANRDDADDILQEVFYRLVRADTLSDPIEQVSAWLYRVARNLIINSNAKKREVQMPRVRGGEDDEEVLTEVSEVFFPDGDSPTPEEEYLRSLVWTDLEEALAELPAEQREVFVMTELDGLPVKEIAQATGVPVATLLSRKHYAVKFLRSKLADLYDQIIYS